MVNSHPKLLQGTEGAPQEKAGLAALAARTAVTWRFEKAQNAKSMVTENENMADLADLGWRIRMVNSGS